MVLLRRSKMSVDVRIIYSSATVPTGGHGHKKKGRPATGDPSFTNSPNAL